mgnify:FL=1|jgi:hypothetical protein
MDSTVACGLSSFDGYPTGAQHLTAVSSVIRTRRRACAPSAGRSTMAHENAGVHGVTIGLY